MLNKEISFSQETFSKCLFCNLDPKKQHIYYNTRNEDVEKVEEFMLEHKLRYSNHKEIKAVWCSDCGALKKYIVTLEY